MIVNSSASDNEGRENGAKQNDVLGVTQRLYLIEVFAGLAITARHFLHNLWNHILRLMGNRRAKPGAVTIQYPEEHRPLSPRLRSLHRLLRREDGSPRCVACMLCETICPARCIYIVATEHPDPNIEKMPARFDIDLGRCVFCGLCVEVCPEDAIRMDTGILQFAAYNRAGMIYSLEQLLSHTPVDDKTQRTGQFHRATG